MPAFSRMIMTLCILYLFLHAICLFLCIPGTAQPFIEPEMIEVPAGPFLAGSSSKERAQFLIPKSEPLQKEIYIETFCIGKYEVTNREYACFIEDGGYEKQEYWSESGWRFRKKYSWTEPRRWNDKDYNGAGKENHPVCAVSWYEAEAYCHWLTHKTGMYYRLPAALEWEKAARGMDGRIFPWGDEWVPEACNWLADTEGNKLPNTEIDGYIYTAPTGSYPEGVSAYGCYDMAGNVLEWCSDILENSHKDNTSFECRTYKGGCFFVGAPRLFRCAWRGGTYPEIGHVYWGIIGFRLASDQPAE